MLLLMFLLLLTLWRSFAAAFVLFVIFPAVFNDDVVVDAVRVVGDAVVDFCCYYCYCCFLWLQLFL